MPVWRSISLLVLAWSFYCTTATTCPQKPNEPESSELRVTERIQKLASSSYTVSDKEYEYEIHICDNGESNGVAVKQSSKKSSRVVTIGRFSKSQVMGGDDWLLLRYSGGDNYTSHCNNKARKAVIVVSCDSSNVKGTMKIHEEFSSKQPKGHEECYYLFGLKSQAACLPKPASPTSLSPGSTFLIIMFSVILGYLGFGFLYQRFIVGAKGIEQIPNLDFWKDFGNLQADGCNFICRYTSKEPSRYRTMDDALADDDDGDDNLLPM